jgi:hypothetical protein
MGSKEVEVASFDDIDGYDQYRDDLYELEENYYNEIDGYDQYRDDLYEEIDELIEKVRSQW